jgi:acyl-CoA hydrolase
MPQILDDVGHCVDAVLQRLGPQIVLALPLGIGKPSPLVNELYRRALRDPGIDLTIITALSLLKPVGRSDLERRLLEPLTARVFGSYVEPEYARAVRAGTVPANIRVIEFFLAPGAFLGAAHAQRNYLSANYTQVASEVLPLGVNVVAHLVARRTVGGEMQLSLGSNPDVTVDLLSGIDAARRAGRDIVLIGETNAQMPFMTGQAQLPPERFDYLVDDPRYDFDLFCPPNEALTTADFAIGMYASALVRDGGTLQIGIGGMGDGVVYALLLRHQQNDAWQEALRAIGTASCDAALQADGGTSAFTAGLFGDSEMFVAHLLELYRAGILRRRVYDSLVIERLLVAGEISERFDAGILERLTAVGVGPQLSAAEFSELQRHGVFREDVEYDTGRVRQRGGGWISADLADEASRRRIGEECLGRQLRGGQVLHAAFFLGPRGFYAALRDLPESDRQQLGMRGVAYVNQLYGPDMELRVLQRRDARFINTTMMMTLLGAAVSDQLESGQVVSGVGGQYNFVAMALALPGARSILCVRATRTSHGRTASNILWSYGHATIPRHLRDVVVSEYGVAELRGRTDEEVIAALLNIADSRFQEELLARAKAAGKIRADYRIPDAYRNNLPERLDRALAPYRGRGLFSEFPFGTDLTAEEVALAHALKFLEARTATRLGRIATVAAAVRRGRPAPRHAAALARMGLAEPGSFAERLTQRLIVFALDATTPGRGSAG